MKYEDYAIWQRSKALAVDVYRELEPLKDWGFKDQIIRSALSVPSNIAEGMERRSNKELIYFLTVSKGSCGEFKTQTYIGAEIGYINETKAQHWLGEAEELSKMIGSLIRKVN